MSRVLQKSPDRSVGISVQGVSFGYGARADIFSDLSFEVPPGQIHALVGRSGLGKTTLLKIILGLFRPHSGKVVLGDGPVKKPGRIRGVVFREDSLLGWLTVADNLLFPEHERPGALRREQALGLLAEAGLADASEALPKALSTGMAKRVELLRALLNDKEYFVGDEPFSSLDVQTRGQLYALWRRLRVEHPRTGILCTHDPLEACFLADRVLVMHSDGAGLVRLTGLDIPERLRGAPELSVDPFLAEIAGLMR